MSKSSTEKESAQPTVGDFILANGQVIADIIGFHSGDIVIDYRESFHECGLVARTELTFAGLAVRNMDEAPVIVSAWMVV